MMHVYTVADMDVNVAFPYIFDTGIVMKDVVFARGWNEIGVISGSCRPGMGNRTDVQGRLTPPPPPPPWVGDQPPTSDTSPCLC